MSLQKQLEQDLAQVLLNKVVTKEISIERMREIAVFILKNIPEKITDKDLIKIIPHLDDSYTELSSVVHKHLIDYENKHLKPIQEKVKILMANQQYTEVKQLIDDYFARNL